MPGIRCRHCGSEAVREGTHSERPRGTRLTWWEVPFGIAIWLSGFLLLAALLYWLYLVPQGNSGVGGRSADLLVLVGSFMVAWVVAGLHMVSVVVDRRAEKGPGKRPRWSREEYLAAARARRAIRQSGRQSEHSIGGHQKPGAASADGPEGPGKQPEFFVRIPPRKAESAKKSGRGFGRRGSKPVSRRYLWCSACGRVQTSWEA